jgi:hypothetical protein
MIMNIGTTDRNIRLVGAAVLLVLAIFAVSGAFAWVLGLIAVVLAATALIGTCPIYMALGMSTRESQTAR